MFKKSYLIVALCVAMASFAFLGCDPAAPGCGSSESQLEVALPTMEEIAANIEKFKIEIIDPITAEVLVTKEGLPGETHVLVVVDPGKLVTVKVTAFDYADVEVSVGEAVAVAVDVTAKCQVNVDVLVDTTTGATDVDVAVDCPETDVNVDVDVPIKKN